MKFTVITSDYHVNRVQLIFKEVLENYKPDFISVESNLEQGKYNTLILHKKTQ